MSKQSILCLFAVGFSVQISAQPVTTDEQPQPKMRAIDRDWEYFKAVPCERINKEVFHSRSEELLLAKRKSQCVNRYKAFLPKPLS